MALLIFDLDDTLYSSKSLRARLTEKIEKKFKEVANVPDHLDLHAEFKRQRLGLREEGIPVSTTHLLMKHGYSRDEFLELLRSVDPGDHIEPDTKLFDTLKKLAEEHDLVILSNSPRTKVDRTLEVLGIKEHFKKIYGGDDWHNSKPDPEILLKIISDMGHTPSTSFHIGDDLDKEIRPANSIGMNSVLVKHWDYTDEEVSEAHHVVEDVHELPAVLQKFIKD